jgi:hypothetical protein
MYPATGGCRVSIYPRVAVALGTGLGGLLGSVGFFLNFMKSLTKAGYITQPPLLIALTKVGKGNRLRYSWINEGLPLVAVALARLQKCKTTASVKFFV